MRSIKILSVLLLSGFFIQNSSAADGARITYDKGTKIEIPEAGFNLKINTEVNVAYSYTSINRGGAEKNSFDPFRERITLQGDVANKKFSYYTQYKFAGSNITAFGDNDIRDQFSARSSSASFPDEDPSLVEAWVQYNIDEQFKVRFGRQKLQFGYSQPAATTKLEFFTRPLAYQVLGELYKYIPSIDVGTTGYYKVNVDNSVLTATLGGFNSKSKAADRDTYVAGVASINYAANGFDRTAEGDLGYTKGVAWTTGLSGLYNQMYLGNIEIEEDVYNIGLDFGLRTKGLSLQSEVFTTIVDPELGKNSNNYGYYIQAGYFVVPKDIEVALRFSGVSLDKHFVRNSSSDSFEYSAVLNKYILGHNLKLQTSVSYYTLDGKTKDQDQLKFLAGISANL
ncbi:MAG: OprO/OprP family phosphate-selective porin [Deltaproteobacteria bacterium]|jgi:hypothetical protein|nr:OprO/OprP family phosphate-selective porin [Deltaproteobacteria bacterium]